MSTAAASPPRRWIVILQFASLALALASVSPAAGQYLRLEDVVAGGDGSGNAPPANTGIDPRTGAFTTTYVEGRLSDSDGINPSPVPGSPFIDSVFFLKGKVPTAEDGCGGCFVQYLTQSGVQAWLDDSLWTETGWNFILKDRNGGVSTPGITVGGVGTFTTAIGIHSAMGITFDLEAFRRRHGDAAVGCFSTFWGMDDCATGAVQLMAMISNDASGVTDLRSQTFTAGHGEFLTIPLPRSARYLTLLTVALGPDACDHGTFARPIITASACEFWLGVNWIWSVWPTRISPAGERIQIRGEAISLGHRFRVGAAELLDPGYVNGTLTSGVVPPLPPGVYDLEMLNSDGIVARLRAAVEVAPPPELTAILPSEVLEDRPTPVAIVGKNLRSDMLVEVDRVGPDGVPAPITDLSFLSGTQLSGATPASLNGLSPDHRFTPDVILIDQDRRHAFPGLLTYLGAGIEKVEPGTVSTGGGTEVTFVGVNFAAGMRFLLGGVSVQNVVLQDSGHVRATSPPLSEGSHSAQLLSGTGSLIFTLRNAVQAVKPGPLAISSVSPNRVFSLGGAEVTLVTTRPHGGAVPRVGGIPLINVQVLDPLTLRGEIPPLDPGFHDADLVDGAETVIAVAAGAVEVLDDSEIRIDSVTPAIVSTLGGTEVTILGSGFSPGFVARIGGIPLEEVEVTGLTILRGVTAPLDPGPQVASLDSGKHRLATLANAVTAVPPVAQAGMYLGHIRPARITSGASRVRFIGAHLPADVVLRIGGVPLADFSAVSPCRLEGTAPELVPGYYRADLFRPGFGVVAAFEDLVEVADPGAPPRPAYIVSEPVPRAGSTRVFVFGNDYSPRTVISIAGRPLLEPVVVSDELIVGRAPALAAGEVLGLRDVVAEDERGASRLASGIRYEETGGAGALVRADANASGQVDLSDAVYLLGFLYLGNPASLGCLEAADADSNGEIEITDAVYLLSFLFLGGNPPQAPFPACGPPVAGRLGCASYPGACGSGGGGAAPTPTFYDNVKLVEETPLSPLDPRVVEIATEEGEIAIHDPPGGKDIQIGDVIAGFTPVHTDAVHNGVAYLLKVEGAISGSCLAAGGGDKVFRVRPAGLAEAILEGDVRLTQQEVVGGRISRSESLAVRKCGSSTGGGGGEIAAPGGGEAGVFLDVDFGSFGILDLHDGDNYLRAGFYQSQIRYNSGVNLGIGIGAGKLKRLTFFSGLLLESQVEFFVDAGLFTHLKKEVRLFHIEKGTVILIGPVPVLVTGRTSLYAGVNLDAGVTMYLDAGAAASYKAGLGFDFDGRMIRNLSGFEEPRLSALPDTPILNVDGFASVKGYLRPEVELFGGLLFKALTGDILMTSEIFGRARVEGHLKPPCFQWGFDAGAKVTMNPQVELFGFEIFDQTFDLVDREWPDLLSGEIGCKAPPVVVLRTGVESTGAGALIHLDASGSYDPDGGPLKFRWDFDDDGLCYRETGSDPRTTFRFIPASGSPCLEDRCTHVIRLRVTDDEKTYTERTTSFTTNGEAGQIFKAPARLP